MRSAAVVALLALAALAIRSVVAAPRLVPSESMLPALYPGDLMLVAKWPYGYSRHSLPMDAPLIRGRVFGEMPERGDIVVVRPAHSSHDVVKRVIGLPGDRVAMRGGTVYIDGRALPRLRVGDLLVPVTPNLVCHGIRQGSLCRYRRYTELLPDGRSYATLDIAAQAADERAERLVPPGHLFLLGDNRDRSEDSRAFGAVPVERLIGRPLLIFWSSDGSARWADPRSWWKALRPERIGPVRPASLSPPARSG